MANKISMEDYEVDLNTDINNISKKMPSSVSSMSNPKELQEFHDIPCESLVPFREKKEGDFSDWNETEFQELVASIREHGVLEAIIVRPIEDNKFEIMAGEHRWRASQEAGLSYVPARVKHCENEEAIAIFSLTNIMKRNLTLRDRAFGCWLYATKTKYKNAEQIRNMIDEGILTKEQLEQPLSRMQLFRYSKLHSLHPDLFDLVDKGIVTVITGARLAGLEEYQQNDLADYVKQIKNNSMAEKLADLGCGAIPNMIWDEENIEMILAGKNKGLENKNTFAYASRSAKAIIKQRIPKDKYAQTTEILEEALDLYFKKYGK